MYWYLKTDVCLKKICMWVSVTLSQNCLSQFLLVAASYWLPISNVDLCVNLEEGASFSVFQFDKKKEKRKKDNLQSWQEHLQVKQDKN